MVMYKMMIIIGLMFCICQSLLTKSSNAFNTSCFGSKKSMGQSYKNGMIYLPLKTFYMANLYLDLRHFNNQNSFQNVKLFLQINNTQRNQMYNEQLPLKLLIQNFQIQASKYLEITAYYNISGQNQTQIQSKQYMFLQTLNINILQPNQIEEKKSFLFVITNKDNIRLPYNVINRELIETFPGYFLNKIQQNTSLSSRLKTKNIYSEYWNGFQNLVLPYIPYLSNCIDSGDYLNYAQITHNESQCSLYGQQTIPIKQFNFGSLAIADNCKIIRQCIYDEIPSQNLQYPFWNTLSKIDTTLFSITSKQHSSFSLNMQFKESDLIPCQIKQTKGTNSADLFPMKVKMKLGYYQVTNIQKLMMTCTIHFSLYVKSHQNFKYNLEIQLQPLSHTTVLLNFGFRWYIYMIVFIIIGLISNLQFIIFWVYHCFVTIKPKIQLSFILFLKLCKEIFKGFIPASLIIIFLTFIVQILMQGTIFGQNISSKYNTFWDYLIINNDGYLADQKQKNYRSSRMGFSYIIISSYIMIELSKLIMSNQRSKKQYQQYEILGRKFKPKEWNRGKLLFVTFIYIFSSIVFISYTVTNFFNENIWLMIAVMQILQLIIQNIASAIYQDLLPTLPFKITLGVLSYLSTMGAIDLYYFILGYLVDVCISTIELIYLSGLQDIISAFIIQKTQQLNKFYTYLLHDEQYQNDKKSDKLDEINNDLQILINNDIDEIQILQQNNQQQYYNIQPIDYFQNQTFFQKQLKNEYLNYLKQNLNKINNNNSNSNNKNNNNTTQKLQYNKSSIQIQQQQIKQLQNNKFKLLIDGTLGMLQYMIQPTIILILWITYDTSNILQSYGISKENSILYFLSSVILAIFFQFNIIIMLHIVQLYFNFDYKVLVNKLLHAFQNKKHFWILQSTQKQQKDQQYQFQLRAVQKYAMSSQMYFIITLYVCCMYFFIIGFYTIITANQNVLQDQFLFLVFLFWIGILLICKYLIKKILYIFNIWGYSSLSDDRNEDLTIFQNSGQEIIQNTTTYLRKQQYFDKTIRFTFKYLNKQIQTKQQKQQQIQIKNILSSKLNTICKKLQFQFINDDFRLQYTKKNKQFIKNNIEKILPLITEFADDDIQWFNRNHQDQKKIKKIEQKNCDPLITDFIANWVKRVEVNRAKRQINGAERQKMLKKCNFCYNTWCIYYGYDGMCLQCSKKLIDKNKKKYD